MPLPAAAPSAALGRRYATDAELESLPTHGFDVLVVGSGIAGLTAALHASRRDGRSARTEVWVTFENRHSLYRYDRQGRLSSGQALPRLGWSPNKGAVNSTVVPPMLACALCEDLYSTNCGGCHEGGDLGGTMKGPNRPK